MCKGHFSLSWQHSSQFQFKERRVNTVSQFDIIWWLVSHTGQHIQPKGSLWLCLYGTVFVILIEMVRIFHCLWHHSMDELDYVNGERGLNSSMYQFLFVFWMWLLHDLLLWAPDCLDFVTTIDIVLELWARLNLFSLRVFFFSIGMF